MGVQRERRKIHAIEEHADVQRFPCQKRVTIAKECERNEKERFEGWMDVWQRALAYVGIGREPPLHALLGGGVISLAPSFAQQFPDSRAKG